MGYRRQRPTYHLVFADEEYAGLEVKVRSGSVKTYRAIASLAGHEFSDPPSPEDLARQAALDEAFVSVLVSWNVEDDDGQPVPATLAGLESLDLPFVLAIVLAWMEAVAGGVGGPLPQPSADGRAPSIVASLPMELLPG